MPRGLVFVGTENINYGFVSSAKIYTLELQTATGLKPVNLPDTTSGIRVPWRLEDLLQAGELKRVTVVLDDGAGKRTNRNLYITKSSVVTFRKPSTEGGLIGQTIDSKKVLSASIPRKASFALA
ncbi:hypothetical protein [Microcoleus anatoxicus]|uniref:Uncharacterized protein n=1 Tax=Microcoleus anatoxicus PTRS2 TaxID=2705321 RepID=A0ABU8YP28_9CYAN